MLLLSHCCVDSLAEGVVRKHSELTVAAEMRLLSSCGPKPATRSARSKKSITGAEDKSRLPVIWSEIGAVRGDFALRWCDNVSLANAEAVQEVALQRQFLQSCHLEACKALRICPSPFAPLMFPRSGPKVFRPRSPRHTRSQPSGSSIPTGASGGRNRFDSAQQDLQSPNASPVPGLHHSSDGSDRNDGDGLSPDVEHEETSQSSSGSVIRHRRPFHDSSPETTGLDEEDSKGGDGSPERGVVGTTSNGSDEDFYSVPGDDETAEKQWLVYTTPAKPVSVPQNPLLPGANAPHPVGPDSLPISRTIVRLLREEAEKAETSEAGDSTCDKGSGEGRSVGPPPDSPVPSPPLDPVLEREGDEPSTSRLGMHRLQVAYCPLPWCEKLQRQVPSCVLRLPGVGPITGSRRHVDEWARFTDTSVLGRGFGFSHSTLPEVLDVDIAGLSEFPVSYWFDAGDDEPVTPWPERFPLPPASDADTSVVLDLGPDVYVHASPAALECVTWMIDDYSRRWVPAFRLVLLGGANVISVRVCVCRQDSVDSVLGCVESVLFSNGSAESPKGSLALTVSAPKIRARFGHVSSASSSSLSEHAFVSGDSRQFPSNEGRPPPKASTPQDLPSQRRADGMPRVPPHSRHRSMFTGAPPNSPVFVPPPPVPVRREGSATAGSAGSGSTAQDEGAMVFGLELTLFGSEVTMLTSVLEEEGRDRAKVSAKLAQADAQFGVVDAGVQAKDVVVGRVPVSWWNHEYFTSPQESVLDGNPSFDAGLMRFGLRDVNLDVSVTETKSRAISCSIGEVASVVMDDAIGGLLSAVLAWEESAMYLALTLSDAVASKRARTVTLANALARLFEDFEMYSPFSQVPRSSLLSGSTRPPMNLISLRSGAWQRREKKVSSRSGSDNATHHKREGRRVTSRHATQMVIVSDRDVDGDDSDGDEDVSDQHSGGVTQAMFRRPGMAVEVPVADARTEPRFVDAAGRRLSEFSRPLELSVPSRHVLFGALARNLLSCLTWREWLQLHSELCEADSGAVTGHQQQPDGVMIDRTQSEIGAVETLLPALSQSTTLWSSWLRKSLQSNTSIQVPDSQTLSLSLTGKLQAATLLLLVPKVSTKLQASTSAEEACHLQILGAGVTASLMDRMQLRNFKNQTGETATTPSLPRDLLLTQCEGFSVVLTPSVFIAMSCIEVSVLRVAVIGSPSGCPTGGALCV
jgi:hypothetical protein